MDRDSFGAHIIALIARDDIHNKTQSNALHRSPTDGLMIDSTFPSPPPQFVLCVLSANHSMSFPQSSSSGNPANTWSFE